MAHSLSAKKRIRQNLKRRLRNKRIKSFVRSRVKKARTLVVNYKPASAQPAENNAPEQTGLPNLKAELNKVYKALDKAITSGIIHRNKAARLKSRLTLALNKISNN